MKLNCTLVKGLIMHYIYAIYKITFILEIICCLPNIYEFKKLGTSNLQIYFWFRLCKFLKHILIIYYIKLLS